MSLNQRPGAAPAGSTAAEIGAVSSESIGLPDIHARPLQIVNLAIALEIAARREMTVAQVLEEMGALILKHRDI
jgi:hypothetical protein